MPQLQELHVSLNDYTTVDLQENITSPSLTVLYLNSNRIESWSEICKLGHAFPNLNSLVMIGNPLSTFSDSLQTEDSVSVTDDWPLSAVSAAGTDFVKLKSLNVSETLLGSWHELEILTRFPCLTDVRLNGIAFFEAIEEKLRRQLMIGYLPHIDRLNGTEVTAEERETADRAFIRYYMDNENKPRRYHDLVSEIGQLNPLADVNLAPVNSAVVTVHFEDRSCTRQFRLNMTAGDVKQSLSKNFIHLPTSAFQLYHNDVGSPYGLELMKFQQRTLLSYRVKDGDEIFIHLK
jgi:hypothetical protein